MNVTYACPNCEAGIRHELDESAAALTCGRCKQTVKPPPGSIEGNRIRRCLVCPSQDLYVRKDFPQRVGVLLVAIGIAGSSVAWHYENLYWTFGILFATALADVLLFAVVGNALMCYRCGAQYRGVEEMDAHGHFNLETHEKYRQLNARLATAAGGEVRDGG